jgi:hypothetical protein
MIKHEIKVEILNSESLKELIERAYFVEGDSGKIKGNQNYMKLDDEKDTEMSKVLTGLHKSTIKVICPEVIDGSIRLMVEEAEGEIRLYPISIYCIKEDRYTFY